MSSTRLTIRFPSGATEARVAGNVPEVGSVFEHGGAHWTVVHVSRGREPRVVTLRPVELFEVGGPVTPARPSDEARRQMHMKAVAFHEHAAAIHDEAAELQTQHIGEMRAIGEPERAERAARLAVKERDLANTERARAENARERITGAPQSED